MAESSPRLPLTPVEKYAIVKPLVETLADMICSHGTPEFGAITEELAVCTDHQESAGPSSVQVRRWRPKNLKRKKSSRQAKKRRKTQGLLTTSQDGRRMPQGEKVKNRELKWRKLERILMCILNLVFNQNL